jgi:uncharacterized circularly permuted ATP-grasp superfamily protein/uncharacterized alpha-E superfamily protein
MTRAAEPERDDAAPYRPLPGVPDEMTAPDGTVRPVWRQFAGGIARLSAPEIEARFARADQYLRDAGVYVRVFGESGANERDWPLSPIPVLIAEAEWERIDAGLAQRAELLEAVVADIYGQARLVADGALPASLIAASPEYLRPLVGVRPADGHFLHFIAFEIGRGPDGTWQVLGDRTQAPSGAGFALENRVATTRAFSDIYSEMHVHRLAGFFRAFRDALQALHPSREGRVGILTPGPLNETYYEHAYIARYLGFILLQGEDLAVVDGRVMIRTVAGLRPVDVLWRRLDADYADPLELNQESRIGTPGLVAALRRGAVSMVNALGTGILEMRAMQAFLPRLAPRLIGQDLLLPSIPTWWCGEKEGAARVSADLESMVIGPALSTRLPFEDTQATLFGGSLKAQARTAAESRIAREGARLVGQAAVTLATTPAWSAGGLVPRPMTLRVFAARTRSGWQVMPGGFARIGSTADPAAITMQRGGAAADVWIVSPRPVERTTLLPAAEGGFLRIVPGSLPSRAADNLFWLGRYIERAEGTLRILRAWHARLAEVDDPETPLLAHVRAYLETIDIDAAEPIPRGLLQNVEAAMTSAGQIRDRFSVDGWLALKDLTRTVREFRTRVVEGDDATRACTVLLRKIAGFAGLLHENMYRFMGWRFLVIGRALERGLHMTRLLLHMTRAEEPDGAHDMLLEIGDSVMTHRRRYSVATQRLTVLDLLALDRLNPRSVLYQLDEIHEQMRLLPSALENGVMSALMRECLRTQTLLALETAESLTAEGLEAVAAGLARISDLVTETYLA